ncbi:MAG: hypothetical protein V3V20_06170 [Algisphaera sp.]
MQEDPWKKLEKSLSQDRLGVYGQDGVSHRIIAARYLWNIALSEALYAPLQMCEIGLRNAIDQAMCQMTGGSAWYDKALLTGWGKKQICKAKNDLGRSKKNLAPGRIVAELNFGFWTSMFESHYETRKAYFLPGGIKRTFPGLPKSKHNRKFLNKHLKEIRTLRNRVFHHERILHWKDLPDQHQAILDTIGWIHSDLIELTEMVDTFRGIHAAGIQPYLDKLDNHLD